jgi:murein DD-endopeptidase MepM/ murein hydrolase activator NlpD
MAYSITPGSVSVNEGAGTLTFTITRTLSSIAETLFVSTTPDQGFANNGDYTGLLNQAVSFGVGQTSQTVTISINNDSIFESNETFGIILQQNASDPANVFLAKSTFTIQDNDAPPSTTYSITPGSATVDEGAGTITFTITRSSATSAETVYVSTTPDQGFANSGDYTGLLDQALSFAAGQTSLTVTIAITNDSLVEGNETFGLIVQRSTSDPVGTFLAKSTFTIQDNDAPPPAAYSITPGSATVNEGAGTVTFTVTRSSASLAETVYVSTTPNQGFANNSDYAGLLNQALSFAAGQTSRTVTIAVTNDSVFEGNETFGLIVQRNASDPVSTFLAKSTFTIQDNDAPPPPSSPVALTVYPATGVNSIGQGNRDNDDSHQPGSARQWAYDFLAPALTDVHAIAGGIVVAVRNDLTGAFRGYGNVVTILHDNGVYATYAHLTAFSATVTTNMRVEAGQIIAKSGDSGSLDGGTLHPNLHIQFGTKASLLNANFSDAGTATLIADGSGDAFAPAYFPKLVIRFDLRADPGLSTDTDYYGTMGIDDFTGNGLANTVFGGGGNDIIRGMGGSDVLQGGVGADTLTGGSGNDRFAYYALNELGDIILDFSSVDDSFQFKGSVFGALPAGVLAVSQFRSQGTNTALDADDRFIFRTTDTTLWFDPDGNGSAPAVLVADLQAGAIMTNADILII